MPKTLLAQHQGFDNLQSAMTVVRCNVGSSAAKPRHAGNLLLICSAQMLVVFYLLILEQMLQGLHDLFGGIVWLRMARQRLAKPAGFYLPRVALFCPVKGLEPGLEENLHALTRFDYGPYEIFFTLAGAYDTAAALLGRIAATSKRPVHIVHAGPARDCGEKVNNLRAAVEQAGRQFEVFVFVDSDGRLPRRWLTRLVAPLTDQDLGAATTFHWLLPRAGGFWSVLAAAWNAPIATYLGKHDHNFCWGGGTAIRRVRFEEIGGLETWRGSVSDDYSLTRALEAHALGIDFVPECLVPSPTDMDANRFFEFTNRQLIITRVYAPKIWARALLGHGLYCATVMLGSGLWAGNWILGFPSLQILLVALLPPILSAIRGALRLAAALELMPEWRDQLLKYGWAWTLLAPLVPFVFLYNALVAGFRRTITWRGTRYELVSPQRTRILAHRS